MVLWGRNVHEGQLEKVSMKMAMLLEKLEVGGQLLWGRHRAFQRLPFLLAEVDVPEGGGGEQITDKDMQRVEQDKEVILCVAVIEETLAWGTP